MNELNVELMNENARFVLETLILIGDETVNFRSLFEIWLDAVSLLVELFLVKQRT